MTQPADQITAKTIGIIGGGQLARMLSIAAGRLGFHIVILDPAPNCPAAQFANRQIIAQYDDKAALDELAKASSAVTYEFENIPAGSIAQIEAKTPVFPSEKALQISQDRIVEKYFIRSIGLSTAAFSPVADLSELEKALTTIHSPAILKTCQFGYDGKGQFRINTPGMDFQQRELEQVLQNPCILEEMVDFDCEISIIGARDQSGNIQTFDPARNVHQNGILSTSTVPCGLSDDVTNEAKRQASLLLDALDYVGVIGVEFFVTHTNELLINEFAPRVHNSGHWTEAACVVSQFEQHIRAISNLPLGMSDRHSDCEMVNLIGNQIKNLPALAKRANTLLHDYGKQEVRADRKMGHYTTLTR